MSRSDSQSARESLYSVDDVKRIVSPIAQRFGVERMWLFGSYARGDFNLDSDLDFRVDMESPCGYFKLAGFYNALEEALGKKVDLLPTDSIDADLLEQIKNDEVIVYEFKP